jgi:hypothetical protein
MRSIDAEHVAEELVKLFSRVGILKEILTDTLPLSSWPKCTVCYIFMHSIPVPTTCRLMGWLSVSTRHAEEACNQGGERLGQVIAVCIICGSTGFHGILAI